MGIGVQRMGGICVLWTCLVYFVFRENRLHIFVIHLLCRWFMWNVKPYFLWKMIKKEKKKIKMPYAVVVFGTLRFTYVEDFCLQLKIYGKCPKIAYNKVAGLGGSVGCAVRLETTRSRVQPPPRSATFFRGDWSWNIFYGHSLPSADSRRAVVIFWRKNVHNTG